MFYKWSCRYFSKPLLTGEEGINARRQEREKLALDYIAKCQNSCKLLIDGYSPAFDPLAVF